MFYRLFNELLADINYTKDDVMHMYHRINKGQMNQVKHNDFNVFLITYIPLSNTNSHSIVN